MRSDTSRIKNITAKLLRTFLWRILVKAVGQFQVIWMWNKKKTICMDISTNNLFILRERTRKIRAYTLQIRYRKV